MDRARQNGYRSQSQVPEAPKGISRPTAGKLRKAWWRREAGNPDDMLTKGARVRAPPETFAATQMTGTSAVRSAVKGCCIYLSAKCRKGSLNRFGDSCRVSDFLKSFRECGYGLAGNLGRGRTVSRWISRVKYMATFITETTV